MVARAWSAATAKRFEVTPPFSHRPAAAALIQLPPTTVARELARQLNHLPASATNE
jgi:hypothetical protein